MDKQLRIVTAKYPHEFEAMVNELLSEGNWRIAETEMSVTDNHYYAMLIQEVPAPLVAGSTWITPCKEPSDDFSR